MQPRRVSPVITASTVNEKEIKDGSEEAPSRKDFLLRRQLRERWNPRRQGAAPLQGRLPSVLRPRVPGRVQPACWGGGRRRRLPVLPPVYEAGPCLPARQGARVCLQDILATSRRSSGAALHREWSGRCGAQGALSRTASACGGGAAGGRRPPRCNTELPTLRRSHRPTWGAGAWSAVKGAETEEKAASHSLTIMASHPAMRNTLTATG